MKKLFSLLLAFAAAVCILLASVMNPFLVRMRGQYHLTTADPLDDATPLMAFTTVVLGGFRGLIADVLWLRVARMQEQGRYFELVQLSDWITRLEPQSTQTWGFHAWNMAYNVSVMMSDDAERWRWVRNGIQLLRKDGLRYNPGDPALYFELGWIFQHKIGGYSDPSHAYYKQAWAEEMENLLGGGRPDFKALQADATRLQHLRTDYRMDLKLMQEVDRLQGPLDWRTPEAQAIYWAFLGRRRAGENRFLPCDRMLFQCMAASFMKGTLTYNPDTKTYQPGPNTAILANTIATYEDALQTYTLESVRTSYKNFLGRAVVLLAGQGEEEGARALFDRLHRTFPSPETAGGYDRVMQRRKDTRP